MEAGAREDFREGAEAEEAYQEAEEAVEAVEAVVAAPCRGLTVQEVAEEVAEEEEAVVVGHLQGQYSLQKCYVILKGVAQAVEAGDVEGQIHYS